MRPAKKRCKREAGRLPSQPSNGTLSADPSARERPRRLGSRQSAWPAGICNVSCGSENFHASPSIHHRAQKADTTRSEFATLALSYLEEVAAYARDRPGAPWEADDSVQAAYERALRKLRDLRALERSVSRLVGRTTPPEAVKALRFSPIRFRLRLGRKAAPIRLRPFIGLRSLRG